MEGLSFYIQRLEKQFLPLTNITNKGVWSLLCVCVLGGQPEMQIVLLLLIMFLNYHMCL